MKEKELVVETSLFCPLCGVKEAWESENEGIIRTCHCWNCDTQFTIEYRSTGGTIIKLL